jgi:hypothetical protein
MTRPQALAEAQRIARAEQDRLDAQMRDKL